MRNLKEKQVPIKKQENLVGGTSISKKDLGILDLGNNDKYSLKGPRRDIIGDEQR